MQEAFSVHEHAHAMDRTVGVACFAFPLQDPTVESVARQQEKPCHEEVKKSRFRFSRGTAKSIFDQFRLGVSSAFVLEAVTFGASGRERQHPVLD